MTGLTCALFAVLLAFEATAASDFHGLVRRAVRGRPQAVRVLVRLLMPVVRARVRRFLQGRAGRRLGPLDADDLSQEIWCKLLEDDARLLLAYDVERGCTPQSYVGLLAQREMFNRLQKENALKRGGDRHPLPLSETDALSGNADPERDAAARELLAEMSVHLEASLPERGRDVLRLVYEEGNEPAEAATALGTTLQVIYNWQHRIRTEARAFLAALEG